MKKAWKSPELEVLDVSMTMKFWPKPPKGPGPIDPTDPTPIES